MTKKQQELLKEIEFENRKLTMHIINIFIIIAFIFIVGILFLVIKRPTISKIEKRELAKFPKLTISKYFSGELTSQLSKYYSDTVPGREKYIEFASNIKEIQGFNFDEVTFHGTINKVDSEDENQGELTTPAVTNKPESPNDKPSEQQTTIKQENADYLINNGIIVLKDRGLMLFGGSKTKGQNYAQIINGFRDSLPSSINVHNIIIPSSVEFYLPDKYSSYSTPQKPRIDNIYDNLKPGITKTNAYSELKKHTKEEIFLRTDHHWTHLGAYYAYVAFCNEIGMEPLPLSAYEKRTLPDYVGSLYGYTNDNKIKENAEDFTYFIPPGDYTTTYYNAKTMVSKGNGRLIMDNLVSKETYYSMFLGGDYDFVKIASNEVKNGRKIIVFKESYGNAFATYLVNNFEEVYVADIRYFTPNAVDYIKKNGITDVLFINNIFASHTDSLTNKIADLK